MKQEQTHKHSYQICACQGWGSGEKNWESGVSRGQLLNVCRISKQQGGAAELGDLYSASCAKP